MRGKTRIWISELVIAVVVTAALLFAQPVNATVPETRLTASDGFDFNRFGYSVSFNGDTAVIGAPFDDENGRFSGSAYVFVRHGTFWKEQAKLTASDGTMYDQFGASVSISGDTAVIGAPRHYHVGKDSGSAYVFVRNGITWTQQQKLIPSDADAGDIFGEFVSVDGDTALIGASGNDLWGYRSGSAYVFFRIGTTWVQQRKLWPNDAEAGDYFGDWVSLDGDTAVIGAVFKDGMEEYAGAAYVFVRSGITWTQQQKLTASDGAKHEHFGASVSISGNTVVVGAIHDDDLGSDSGSAYIFVRNEATWTQQQKLTASDGTTMDQFGWSVSVDGDMALIGAIGDDDLDWDSGSAYVFVRTKTKWTEATKLTASDGQRMDMFGVSGSVDGDTAVVGSWHLSGEGTAYVYDIDRIALAAEAIENLVKDIDGLDIPMGAKTSLCAKLHGAKSKLTNDQSSDDHSACNELDAFINQVIAMASLSKLRLTSEQAEYLRQAAEDIKVILGCQ